MTRAEQVAQVPPVEQRAEPAQPARAPVGVRARHRATRSPAAPARRRRRRPVSPSAFRRTSARLAQTILPATGSRANRADAGADARPVGHAPIDLWDQQDRLPFRLGHHRSDWHASGVQAECGGRDRASESATDRKRSGAGHRSDRGNRRRGRKGFSRYRNRREHRVAGKPGRSGDRLSREARLPGCVIRRA